MSASPLPQPVRRRRRWGRWLLVAWLLSLGASHLVWRGRDTRPAPRPGDRVVTLSAVDGAELIDERVDLAYREFGAAAGTERATLVLLHGSPGTLQDFDALAARLPADLRVLVPDLPGFGSSQRDVPDYSARAHARYLEQLFDELGVARAHIVAFSMGGAVAAELAALAPERVSSLIFVAALGTEELELFGDHELNHLIHGLQLRGIEALRLLVPHFGGADGWVLGLPYARNFHDTDQRRVRPALERYAGPMLIVHGEDDFLVPLAAAQETYRIVPQSELVVLEQGHFVLWTRTDDVADLISAFVEEVEEGRAATRASATLTRAQAARAPFDPGRIPPASGPTLLILLLLFMVGTLVSEDLTCIAAGLMVAQGRITFGPAVLGCMAGIFVGDIGLFLAGRWFGRPLVRHAPVRWFLSSDALERASDWFRRKGPRAIFLSRFMPGLRLPTYFAAGVLRTSFPRFVSYFLLAVLAWTPLLVGFAVVFGAEAMDLLEEWGILALLVTIFLMLFIERIVVRLFTFRGRRALVGAWRRWTRWEFWPPWLFYPPVLAHVAWLALRHRSLLVLTAVNPGIPTGGFIGENKSEILSALDPSSGHVAASRLLEASEEPAERAARALEFASETGYPVVFKPEVGQRGSGVIIVEDEAELEDLAREMEVDHIVQEFVPGPEFGLFYVREPDEDRGRLFSITEKQLPELVGDGEHTLEQLILLDERSVAAAPRYMRLHLDRLQEVPTKGERIGLGDVAAHCLGAIFLDGSHFASPELESSVDALSRSFDGFYFGRYDVRAESVEALRSGHFKVLELNGMTSEATHIYDPSTSLREAYRVLFEQWRLAFRIAAKNHAAGAPLSSWGAVAAELFGYRSKQRSHCASGPRA